MRRRRTFSEVGLRLLEFVEVLDLVALRVDAAHRSRSADKGLSPYSGSNFFMI